MPTASPVMRTRTKTYTLTGLTASTNGVVDAKASVAQTPLVMSATPVDLSATPRKLSFTTAGDLSNIAFGVFGRDANGYCISEVIEGLSSTASRVTRKSYAYVDKIVPNYASSTTVSVGWLATNATPWIWTGRKAGRDQKPIAQCIARTVSGTPTGNWEVTYDQFDTLPPESIRADVTAAMVIGTVYQAQGEAVRFVLTSTSGSAEVKITRPGL